MRLTFVTSGLQISGGTRVIIEYANRLALKGHGINIVSPKGLEDTVSSEVDKCVSVLRTTTDYSRHPRVNTASLAFELAKTIPYSDCIIATYAPTVIPTLFASTVMRKGVPYWLYQDYLEMFDNRPVEQWILKVGPRFFRKVLVVSKSCRDEVMRNSARECVIVGEGLSHREVFVPRERNSAEQGKRILVVGDSRPRKGLFDFLEAATIVYRDQPDLQIAIVTKDHLSLNLNLPITVYYRPGRAELARLYADCDVFAYAAWWESFGLPPLEAMACGAPVVLTDSRGVREFAVHELNCLMTPPRDPLALANAILRVMSDPGLAHRLSKEGIKTAERFDWQTPVGLFEQAILGT